MRFSKLLIPTLKEAPKDAVLPSHIYLVRGGFIYQVASGIYDFLPLGKKVLDKVRAIIKEELDNVGCQEVQLGFVTPAELWKRSGRYEKYGSELLRFEDRKGNEFVLGPTHEEMMVELAKQFINSYKQLPMNLYQINLKFRDEARPRFGLMRGREFIMKDGYSFHADREDMVREFELMEATYRKIFTRMGLDFRVVEADSGAIGGEGSKEFMVLADSGEDTIVVCEGCDYAANIEAAKRKQPTAPAEAPEADLNRFHTPDVKTIEDLAKFFYVDPYYLVKTVAKKALYDEGKSEIVLFFLRGSDELQEVKAANSVGANELADVTEEELEAAGLVPGFMGPIELIRNAGVVEGAPPFHEERAHPNLTMVFDTGLEGAKNMICGANEKDYHIVGADLGVLKELKFADLAQTQEGDVCTKCGGRLTYTKGIEVGHIFQLGTRYSEPLKAEFLDQNGKSRPFVMGTYGIGVSRLLAAVIEQHHDEKGSIWPLSVAPFEVVVVVGNVKDDAQREAGEKIYKALKEKGIDVLLDDRAERFGFKMKDFELIGFPYAVVVGKKLSDGQVELIERTSLQKEVVALDHVVGKIAEKVK
ncbi:proline--tRNA ligase [Hydrogenimonas cancrithermarum]|uniref:Proline--tRNA ligase n=1 Tax=Hydrogenimonas cancrithermarum TaxID=2993563 RepID=A0ABN6WSY2_9BACT|nr:proline--tRNA ligase [Hydrogenimonas cancrithermarum]BDY12101.1 proline--tRNA ligase [Hydrogenimonas cancrithermarum]